MAAYWVGGGTNTNWNASPITNWSATSGGVIRIAAPTSTVDVIFDANSNASGTSVLNVDFTVKSFVTTGYTGSFTHASGVTLTTSGASGAFTLASGMTYTLGSATTSALSFNASSGTTAITTNGKTVGNVTFNGGATYQLQDALTAGKIYVGAGIIDTNGKAVQSLIMRGYNADNYITLTLGATAWTLTGSDSDSDLGSIFAFESVSDPAGDIVVDMGTSTIIANGSGSGDKSLMTGASGIANIPGFSFYNLQISGSGSGTFNVGKGVSHSFTVNTPPHTIVVSISETLVVGSSPFSGTSGNLITLQSSSAGTAWNVSKSSGNVVCDYLSLKDSHAAGGATFYAGSHSTSVSGNTGWQFIDPPAAANPAALLISM